MNNINYKERNQSIELLRTILMTLIVFGHIIGHGVSQKYSADGAPKLSTYLWPLYSYHVDTFIFISGYYSIKLRTKKFCSLLCKMVVYSILAVCLCDIFQGSLPDMSTLFRNIYPISACDWWFMSGYLFLMLISPFINEGVEHLDKKTCGSLLIALYLISFRADSSLMLFIYMLGRYLNTHPCTLIENHAKVIFTTSVSLFCIFHIICLNIEIHPDKLYQYMSPFTIVSATSLFYIFKNIRIKSKMWGYISSGTIAAYLLTDHKYFRPLFTHGIAEVCNENIITIIIISFIVVILISLFDKIISKSYEYLWIVK